MPAKEVDEERVARIRAVISALTGKASNNPGVKEETVPAALIAFFVDELREQLAEIQKLLEKLEP